MEIGEKLRSLRQARNLTQEEMADRCELSKGFISQVERDIASPSIATLKDMLECLGSSLPEFFRDDTAERVTYTPADMFEKNEDGARVTWLVPSAQKNVMEPICVELDHEASSQEMPPHTGEEFGYMLAGAAALEIGGKRRKLRAGDSFCLRQPTAPHRVINTGKRPVRLIWICTPPNF